MSGTCFLGEKANEHSMIRNYKLGNYLIQHRQNSWSRNVWKSENSNPYPNWRKGFYEHKWQVAVKVLEKDRMTEAGDLERVTREIHILKKIRHPYIIQLFDVIMSITLDY